MLAVSCVKSSDEPILEMSGDEGVLTLNIDFGTKAVTGVNPDENFTLRVYRYDTGTDGQPAKGLVRKYTALADVPQYIWLMSGSSRRATRRMPLSRRSSSRAKRISKSVLRKSRQSIWNARCRTSRQRRRSQVR